MERSEELKAYMKELASKGGKKVREKYGKEYFSELAKRPRKKRNISAT